MNSTVMNQSSDLYAQKFIVYQGFWIKINIKHSWGNFYEHGLALITAWISNHLPGKEWDEIT